uniref:hypothetical protein n=1 Tax=Hassallia byssoidea TaxID=482630 RepID=UPI001F1CF8AE|nr:hypothetical protein [Hassalia byssoidea]
MSHKFTKYTRAASIKFGYAMESVRVVVNMGSDKHFVIVPLHLDEVQSLQVSALAIAPL